MDVLSVSPFSTGSVLWRSRPDRWTLTVVCKGTYDLVPGEATLAPEQEGVNERDNHWDDDPRRSVYAPSDLAPFKPRADIMLVGHAFAPRSEMVRSLVARLAVGEMEKAVEVVSPRVWTREGELREGPRWNKLPIRWEYAAGGIDTWNPVGVSPNAPPDAYGQRILPNLQPPGLRVAQWNDLFVPVGLGSLASSWRIRREKLGRRAEGWSDDGWPQIPLDDDFDGEFFQAAPPDQQIDTLHDDESLVLEYLHPEHPRLATKLPGLHPHAFVDVPGAAPHDLVMTADTLWIDTDRAICTVTWRGQVAVDGPAQAGRVIIALEEAGQRLTWPVVASLAGLPVGTAPVDSGLPPMRPAMPTLPFQLADSARGMGPSPLAPQTMAGIAPPAPPEPESSEDAPNTPRAGGARQATMTMTGVGDQVVTAPGWRLGRAPSAPDRAEVVEKPAPSVPRPEVRVPPPAGTALEVLWLSTALTGRLRKNSAWARILSPGNKAARNTMTMVSVAAADTAEAMEAALETEVASILARGTPSEIDLDGALFESTAHGGALVPELLLLAGDLELPFDEVAWINALVTAATPLAGADPRLGELLEHAAAMARTPLQAAPEVASALAADIREAWAQANRVLPPEHLDAQATRSLVLTRAYQRRDVMGETWVRALFTPTGTPAAVPAYVPEAAARRLPLFARFPARVLADVTPQQDQFEESAVALKINAVARVVSRGRRGDAG
ncbi:MAG: DUF2169 domain-containing protein [Minicystis sp.]